MDIIKAFFFILLQGKYNGVFAVEQDAATFSRSAFFTMQENKRLEGHVFKQFKTFSLISCHHSCFKNDWCTSTNFKESSEKNGKGICELNKHEANDENRGLSDEQGVTFSLLLKVKYG